MERGFHAALFRALLRLYPPRFRATYGEEMTRFFVSRLSRARARGGATSVMKTWIRAAADVMRTAAAEWRTRPARSPSQSRGDGIMTSFANDLRYALRRLTATPLFSLAAVAILGIGIGLNAAVFNLVDTMLFRPAPFEAPEEIVHIYQDGDGGEPSSTSFPAYRDMAALDDVFEAVAATTDGVATWETDTGPVTVALEYATSSYFRVLGLRPSLGRWFEPRHDHVGDELVAVVSHRTWRTRMGGDPDVVGRTVRLNNRPVTVIGVGPAAFNGQAGALITDFWLSISSTPVGGPAWVTNLERRQDHWYQVKARLATGVGIERARSALAGLAIRLAETYPSLNEGRDITIFGYDEVRLHPGVDADLFTANVALLGAAGLVLLLACSSLATLLLVRGIARGQEMAVREALGASCGRVVRLLLLEGLLLSLAGAAAGLALARWSMDLLPIPIPGGGLDARFGHRVVLFGLALALITGLAFGLIPALRSSRSGVAAALRDEARGQSAGRRVSWVRGGLVTAQVVLSIVLVVGAGLLTRSLANTQRVDPGVDVDRIAVVDTDLQQAGVTDGELAAVSTALIERVRAIPGVTAAALTTRLPVEDGWSTTRVVDGYTPAAGTGSVELPLAFVSPDYFAAMGIPVLAGRGFTADDRDGSAAVIVVSRAAARAFWRGDERTAVGGRIRSEDAGAPWAPVVGVVGDVKVESLQEPPTPMIYFPLAQETIGSFSIVARTPGDPAALLAPLRSAVRDVRSTLPVTRLTSLDDHFGDALAGPRTVAAFMGAFSLLGLLLASLGVYAVVAFAVEARTRELGIRAAMGATRNGLVRMVVQDSLALVVLGIALGLGLAVLAARAVQGVLFGVGAIDFVTLAGAAVLLLAAAGTAAFLPARRAARADPVEALRY